MLRSSRLYREACPVCLGDMVEDEQEDGWLVCLICARSFPTAEIEAMLEPPAAQLRPRVHRDLSGAA